MPNQKQTSDVELQFENFLEILNAIVPLVERIKASLQASSRNLPAASMSLNNVTSATESATVEILNTLGTMSQYLGDVEQGIASLGDDLARRRALAQELAGKLDAGSSLAEVKSGLLSLADVDGDVEVISKLTQSVDKAKNDSMNIAMALQVQDITTQQIAGVLDMISSVETHLTRAMRPFEGGPVEEGAAHAQDESKAVTYDKAAQYTKSTVKQDDADRIIQEFLTK
jgi:chemotaxis regulatin CheY-phosphate phosphatase CheZ